jgi:hypothetical protein
MPAPGSTSSADNSTTTDASGSTLGLFGAILGSASMITALIISGYLGITLGALGLPLSLVAHSSARASGRTGLATTAVVLNALGLGLGLTAQLMKWYLMSRGG